MSTLKRALFFLTLVAVAILMGAGALPAQAQSYSYRVPDLVMQVYVNPNGSVRIVYDITFENLGSTVEIIDIGLPHSDYSISTMQASLDGVALDDIRTSEYIDIGVEIHLHSQAIPQGATGTLHFEATMPDMVYQDTTDRTYASLRIGTTWFEEGSVQGPSDVRIAVHLPEGVEPDEVRFQQAPYTELALFQGRAVAIWEYLDSQVTAQHDVGVSFPQRVMDRVIRMSLIDLVRRWLLTNPQARFLLGALAVGLLALLFFRFSGGTGCSVFFFLAAGLVFLLVVSPLSVLLAIPVLIALVIVNEVRLKKRRKDYLPPIAQVEGGGIKRGLTAPESAVLLAMPLTKVLTLVVFGLLEKGVIETVNQDPFTVTVAESFKTWGDAEARRSAKRRRETRRQAARNTGTVIHAYEDPFLDEIERNPGKPIRDINFTEPVEGLIKATAAKMKGFDLSDTQDYYRRVIDRAMQQAAAIGEMEQREQYLDQYLPWVMMNDTYPTVLTHGGYHYWPIWARPAQAQGSGMSLPRGVGRPSVGRQGAGKTSFGDVAASFSGWAETTMGGLAGAVLPSSMNIPTGRGGFADLSGVDRVTGDVFQALAKASSSGSKGGRRSGGGGGCACACAGCACACACAGGGR